MPPIPAAPPKHSTRRRRTHTLSLTSTITIALVLILTFCTFPILSQSSEIFNSDDVAETLFFTSLSQQTPRAPCKDSTNKIFRCQWVSKGKTKKKIRRRCATTSPKSDLPYSNHCPSTCQTCVTSHSTTSIHVSSFGAVGDGITDDSASIQSAIDYAFNDDDGDGDGSKAGGVVRFGRGVYHTTTPIIVKDGVRLVGEGYGESPLQIKFGGTVIAYCGTDYAVKVTGHNAGLERMAVYDWPYTNGHEDSTNIGCEDIKAAGGVVVDAVGRGVESVVIREILIYHFMNGTALTLRASQKGGIGFGSYYDIRIRHAKRGIHLVAEEESFVNANSFHGGAVTGTMTDWGLLAEGPGPCNGNRFDNIAIEPSKTLEAHVVVRGSKTNVVMNGVRLEGTKQDAATPMVHIYDGSYNNVINGMIGHQAVRADFNRNPDVNFLSYKGTSVQPTSNNAFENAAFHGVTISEDGTATIPKWKLEQDPGSASISVSPPSTELFPNHRVLHLTFSPTYVGHVKFLSSYFDVPSLHSTCSFGIYARTSVPRGIVATMFSVGGNMVSSTGHSGSGTWEFIGSAGPFRKDGGPRPAFYIYGDVELAAPALSFGTVAPAPGFEPLASTGGVMTGTLTMGMVTVLPPVEGNFWELPHEGNIFEMGDLGEDSFLITRINGDSGSNRFPNGTVITVLLPEVGVTFKNGGYLKLKGEMNFSSTMPNSSITLVNVGSDIGYGASWREISRNE